MITQCRTQGRTLGFFLLSVCCSSAIADQDTVTEIARVNGEAIYQESVDMISGNLGAGNTMKNDSILDELINLKLLSQAARQIGLDKEPPIAIAIALQAEQTLANAYTSDFVENIEVSTTELQAQYKRYAARLEKQAYRLSHILLATEADAQDVIIKLANGGVFEELVSIHTIEPIKDDGGDLGWHDYGAGTFEHSEQVEKLALNEISVPLATSYGWHIFKQTDSRGDTAPEFESIRDELYSMVVRAKVEDHLAFIKEQSSIDIANSDEWRD